MARETQYQVQAISIAELLQSEAGRYEVPHFQRRYSWGPGEVSQLIDDLFESREYEEWLKDNSEQSSYFLGSIVLSSLAGGYSVLDGQQRITTLALILSVLRSQFLELGTELATDEAYLIKGHLESRKAGKEKSLNILLQEEDRKEFASLIADPASYASFKRSKLARAVQQIYEAIQQHWEIAFAELFDKYKVYLVLLRRILYSTEIVRIVAPSDSEAFRLFETLNDRGLDLNAADLIKNRLFAVTADDWLAEAIEKWQEMQDAVGEDQIVHFLRYYWIAFHGNVRKPQLFSQYGKSLAKMDGTDAAAFAETLAERAQLYRVIVQPDSADEGWTTKTLDIFKILKFFQARSCRPALLACAYYAPDYLEDLAKVCETVTVRYSLVGELNPNQLERAYASLCKVLRTCPEKPGAALTEAIASLFRDVPNDESFKRTFSAMEISRITPTWREVLRLLNSKDGTGETTPKGPRFVHAEHILPSNPSEKALQESGFSNKKEANPMLAELVISLFFLRSLIEAFQIARFPKKGRRSKILRSL